VFSLLGAFVSFGNDPEVPSLPPTAPLLCPVDFQQIPTRFHVTTCPEQKFRINKSQVYFVHSHYKTKRLPHHLPPPPPQPRFRRLSSRICRSRGRIGRFFPRKSLTTTTPPPPPVGLWSARLRVGLSDTGEGSHDWRQAS